MREGVKKCPKLRDVIYGRTKWYPASNTWYSFCKYSRDKNLLFGFPVVTSKAWTSKWLRTIAGSTAQVTSLRSTNNTWNVSQISTESNQLTRLRTRPTTSGSASSSSSRPAPSSFPTRSGSSWKVVSSLLLERMHEQVWKNIFWQLDQFLSVCTFFKPVLGPWHCVILVSLGVRMRTK